ncbi:hypothetical protein GCM10007874_69450 [Labrys miyagiensis]|uniref:Uncharacterized protein n=1 Tax=Labrys miyagiensis TaxID=346912 RepID=A0ABQ6CZ12_9HYPH|nr:hypothetical protein [Labrys miyagiensis]GLS23924.1 hypothetical protein GCM10007874_69450 [Labrys miyagiensis]
MSRMADIRFVPKLPRMEARHEETNKVARAILDDELAIRAAKTERLRQARLAREAVGTPERPPVSEGPKRAIPKRNRKS